MGKKFDPRQCDKLLAPERAETLRPAELLRSLGLKAGDTIADIGCGPGFFTVPAAEIVGPTGKVIAADIQSDMIAAIMTRVADLGLRQVEISKTSEMEAHLPDNSVDLVLLAYVLHEVTQRAGFLFRLRHALRPATGRIAVIEWEKIPTESDPPLEERLTPEDVLSDAQCAGFKMVERRQLTAEHYAIVLQLL